MDQPMPCGEPVDLQQIRGQEHAKRALEVAAAGGHHLMLIGAPESGKTTLASALFSLLPPLTEPEAAGVAAIRTLSGQSREEGEARTRPCVAPRPDSSRTALYGGR